MNGQNSFDNWFNDLKNGINKAVDMTIGQERTGFTDSINSAINRLENAVNNTGRNPQYQQGQGYPPPQWQGGYQGQGYPQNPGYPPNQGYPQYQGAPQYQGYPQNNGFAPNQGYPPPQNRGYPPPAYGNGYGQPDPNMYRNVPPPPQVGGQPYGNGQPYGGGYQQPQYGGYQQGNVNPPPPPPPRCVSPEELLNDGSPVAQYVTVTDKNSGRGTSFELPSDFVEMSTGSAAEMLYMYRADDGDFRSPRLVKPYICIIPAGGGIPLESDCTAACIGLMEICSKSWVNYRGKAARYYGFTRRDDSRQLLVLFCEPNVVGTPLGNKMITVLDHAAETYREG